MSTKLLFALSAGYWLAEVTWTEWLVLFAAALVIGWLVATIRELRATYRTQQELQRRTEHERTLRLSAATSYRPVLVRGGKR